MNERTQDRLFAACGIRCESGELGGIIVRDESRFARDVIAGAVALRRIVAFRVRWREDAPGAWLYHCHVESHMEMGMIGVYRVSPR